MRISTCRACDGDIEHEASRGRLRSYHDECNPRRGRGNAPHKGKPWSTGIRLWSKVDLTDPDGCWPFRGHKNPLGYGYIRVTGGDRITEAHRVAYSLAVGPIPEGLSIHHTCGNRACCNPDHLQPMDHATHCRMHFSKPIPYVCEQCGVAGTTSPSQSPRRYCSRKCFHESRRAR